MNTGTSFLLKFANSSNVNPISAGSGLMLLGTMPNWQTRMVSVRYAGDLQKPLDLLLTMTITKAKSMFAGFFAQLATFRSTLIEGQIGMSELQIIFGSMPNEETA